MPATERKIRLGRAIAEFSLIVVGVLCALAVENWAHSREEREVEGEYLRSLEADLQYNEEHLEELAQDIGAVRQHIELASDIVAGEGVARSASEAIASLYLASRGNFPALLDNAYEDLQATGNLRLIRDPSVRHSIVAYHREVERWGVDNYALIRSNRLPYRNSVRSRLPLRIQEAIRSECPLRRVPPTCALAGLPVDLSPTMERVLADPELERSLTLWASSALTSASNVDRLLGETRQMYGRLQELLSTN